MPSIHMYPGVPQAAGRVTWVKVAPPSVLLNSPSSAPMNIVRLALLLSNPGAKALA